MLVDFTNPKGTLFKFPSKYHLTRGPGTKGPSTKMGPLSLDSSVWTTDPIGGYLKLAKEFKAQAVGLEIDLSNRPELRTPFSRDELLTNRRFPFL